MEMYMYLLNAKTANAFWIPNGAKTPTNAQYPWCLTWQVNDYKNVANSNTTLRVGTTQPYQTVNSALSAIDPTIETVEIQVDTSVADNPIVIAGRSVNVKGAASTLDRHGNPTITIKTQGVTVAEGAYLRVENLIVDAGGSIPAIVNNGGLSLKNCLILGAEKGAGIVHNGGILTMDKSQIVGCGGDGLRVTNGHALLVNSAISANLGNGIRNENGNIVLKYCGLLGNRAGDLATGAAAKTEATDTVLGSVAPGSKIIKLINCLLETLPSAVAIDYQENCIFGKRSGYVIENGRLAALMQNSPCIGAGTPLLDIDADMNGAYRSLTTPTIGPLEASKPLAAAGISNLQLNIQDADLQTKTDSLKLTLDVQAPQGFSLKKGAVYTLSFGDYRVASDQFARVSKTRNGLLFATDSGDSSLALDLYPKQKQLRITLVMSNVQLQLDVVNYVLGSDNPASNPSIVYIPIRFAAGDFQTGEAWISFTFAGQNAVGTGSTAAFRPTY